MYLVEVFIKEGRFFRTTTFEKESWDEVLKLDREKPYNWRIEAIYKIGEKIDLANLK